jgi:hypothetical protein
MRKIVFSMALAALLCFLLPAYTATSKTTVGKFDSRTSQESVGFYDVLVLNDEQWQQAGIEPSNSLPKNSWLNELNQIVISSGRNDK